MITAKIKRGITGIDGILARFGEQQPEEVRKIDAPLENRFSALLKKYEQCLETEFKDVQGKNFVQGQNDISDILSSEEINAFLQTTIQFEEHKQYAKNTGLFISKLIQNSYNAGNTEFTLNTNVISNPLIYLCAYLEAIEKNKLVISITGDVGDLLGWASYNCTYTVTGNVGYWLGYNSNNCIYTVTGNVGDELGQYSNNCTYSVTGNVGDGLGSNSTNCTYSVTGNVGRKLGWDSKDCTYKTPYNKLFQRWKRTKTMPPKGEGNTIIYLKPDGTEEVCRK